MAMNMIELVVVGILFVVLGFSLTIGQNILTQNAQNLCTDSWVLNRNNATNATVTYNPLDGSTSGCCQTMNRTYQQGVDNGGVCVTWRTSSYALNSTYYGMTANNTLAFWLPIIAIAVAAGFVISILLRYLLGSVRSSHGGI
jgi:hypothetical protein